MKVTVCQLHCGSAEFPADWAMLVDHVRTNQSDFVLLPEMALSPWLPGTEHENDEDWHAACVSHDAWIARFDELGGAAVTGSRPVVRDGVRHNEGYIWTADDGYRAFHTKYYVPDHIGFYEATWYRRGEKVFDSAETAYGKLGMMICTDLWFMEHSRGYGQQGAHMVLNPRCTEINTRDKWLLGGRITSVVSGAYSLSSNWVGSPYDGLTFGGLGWVCEPHRGDVLGITTEENPIITVEIDLAAADAAKSIYPRTVPE